MYKWQIYFNLSTQGVAQLTIETAIKKSFLTDI